MELLAEYIIQWSVSNAIGLLVLVIAIKNTRLARLLFAIMFFAACWVNISMAYNDPDGYMVYASLTPFDLYADFINGWFKDNITTMVSLIAIGQGLIAIGMILKNGLVRLACIGSVVFFVAISPLGVGSGFPFSIFTSIAIYFVLKNDDLNFIWKSNAKNQE